MIQRCLGWQLQFVLLPKVCELTGKRIWLKKAYKGMYMCRDDSNFYYINRWRTKESHIFERLKE